MSLAKDVGAGDSPPPTTRLDYNGISRKTGLYTKYKAIGAGKNLEIYEYQIPILVGKPNLNKEVSAEETIKILTNPEEYQKINRTKEYKKRNVNRAKDKIRRLVQANFDKVGKFLTLTFADTDKFDVKSLTDCHNRLEYFIKKLRKLYPGFRYIAVPEFQDKNDSGAVHYHLMLDIPFTRKKVLQNLWNYGFVNIKKVTNPAGIGLYMAKYLSKASNDTRFQGRRTYYASKNLKQPAIQYNQEKITKILNSLEEKGIKPDYTSKYESEWQGEICYSSYNLYQHSTKKKK